MRTASDGITSYRSAHFGWAHFGWARFGRLAVTALAALGLLAALSACGMNLRSQGQASGTAWASAAATASATAIPVGSSTHTISVDGLTRSYIVYRPATLPAAAPLVVMMHGGFGSASQAEKSYGWNTEAASGHFLVAYPDGFDKAWNAGGGCCGIPAKDGVDDIGFITAMVSAIEHSTGVNAGAVYATGISNGGIMAYDLACHTTVFAAIGPDSATELGGCQDPATLSVIAIHGTADKNIPYDGGEGDGVAHIDGPAIPALNASWRQAEDCAAPAVTTVGVVTTSLAACPGGRAVELVTIAGAGHQWPGGVPNVLAQKLLGTDPPSTALNATQVIWQFFAAHAR
jgi:polyhydroxybutyrate depolymerase